MILSPIVTSKEGDIRIKHLCHPLQKEERPIQIKVYCFKDFQLTSFTSFGEFICRRMKLEEMPMSTFVVDKYWIWQNMPIDKITTIVLCGKNSFSLGQRLLQFLLNKFKLGIDQVFLNFFEEDFIKGINNITFHKIDYEMFFKELNKINPVITTHFYRKGKWEKEGEGPIEKIKININIGDLKYRVFTRGKWTKWVNNGEEVGIEDYYIKGFQFQYTNKEYILYYQYKLNNKYSDFKDICRDKEFKSYIQDLKFKLEEVK